MTFPTKEQIRLCLPRCPICEAQVFMAQIIEDDRNEGPPSPDFLRGSALMFKCGTKLIWDFRISAGSLEKVNEQGDPLPWRWRTSTGCRKQMEEKLLP